jgi:hypothetical protein
MVIARSVVTMIHGHWWLRPDSSKVAFLQTAP